MGGPWKGQYNGHRRYKADFSEQVLPMGTYHLLGGAKVRVVYPGNTRTCARCHQGPLLCPGGGLTRDWAEQGGQRLPLYHHMSQLWDKVGYQAEVINSNDDDDNEESESVSRQEPVLQVLQTVQPCSTPAQPPDVSSIPVIQSEQLVSSEGNISQGLGQYVMQPSPEHIFITESSVSDQQSVEEVLCIGSQDDNYSDGVHISTGSQNSNYMTEPKTLAQTPDVLQKISPIIQEKVDKFEIDEIKRKADESPEL